MVTGNGNHPSRRQFLSALGVATIGGLAGCGARGDPTDLEGEIVMDGSNTVFPHGAAVAEEFMWRNGNVRIPASGSGTGAGFRRFCTGETEFQNASRAILGPEDVGRDETSEVEQCSEAGVEYLELPALLDGIAIMKHPENNWCDCLTVEELRRIWERESEVETWRDVRPDADPPWPDEEIDLYGRDSASGTFDYFTKEINGEYGNIRDDYSGTPDTNVIVRGVRGNPYAMGFGGAGYYEANRDEVDVIEVDAGDGCVEPDEATIEEGTYRPLSRAMYVYVRKSALAREEVAAFARFYFQEIDEDGYELGRELGILEEGEQLAWTQWAARRVGYYAIPDELVEENDQKLRAAIEEVSE